MTNWIKCSERMPTDGETVIAIAPDRRELLILWYDEKRYMWFTPEGDKSYKIKYFTYNGKPGYTLTHWMPLPEPPSEEE